MKSLLLLLFSIMIIKSFAQVEDSISLSRAIIAQQINYQNSVNTQSPLYNGSAYVKYWNKEIGHPYFESDQFQKSIISYKGFVYRGIPLKYDILKDELVISNATGEYEMELLKEHLSTFTIGKHEFIKIVDDSIHAFMPAPGFYELLYKGNSAVIAKYHKRVEASLKAEENSSKFVQSSSYYVKINAVYHLIDNSNDFLNLHKEQKAVLRKYRNKEKLNFAKEPEKTLVSLAKYFDLISHD